MRKHRDAEARKRRSAVFCFVSFYLPAFAKAFAGGINF
jgi:hypothetical protein